MIFISVIIFFYLLKKHIFKYMSLYYYGSFYFSDKIDETLVSVIQMSFLMNTTVLFTIIWNYIDVDVYIHADYLQYLGIFRVSFNYVSIKYLCALHSEFSKMFFVYRYSVERHFDLYVLDFWNYLDDFVWIVYHLTEAICSSYVRICASLGLGQDKSFNDKRFRELRSETSTRPKHVIKCILRNCLKTQKTLNRHASLNHLSNIRSNVCVWVGEGRSRLTVLFIILWITFLLVTRDGPSPSTTSKSINNIDSPFSPFTPSSSTIIFSVVSPPLLLHFLLLLPPTLNRHTETETLKERGKADRRVMTTLADIVHDRQVACETDYAAGQKTN